MEGLVLVAPAGSQASSRPPSWPTWFCSKPSRHHLLVTHLLPGLLRKEYPPIEFSIIQYEDTTGQ